MNEPIFSKTIQEFISLRGKWESFDEFRKQNYGVWIINMNANALREWMCTSPSFHKNYCQCKHCLILQIRQKYVNPPVEHPNVPLDQKRMRGRLSEAKRDLPTQWLNIFLRWRDISHIRVSRFIPVQDVISFTTEKSVMLGKNCRRHRFQRKKCSQNRPSEFGRIFFGGLKCY